jgi:hypothetical protein
VYFIATSDEAGEGAFHNEGWIVVGEDQINFGYVGDNTWHLVGNGIGEEDINIDIYVSGSQPFVFTQESYEGHQVHIEIIQGGEYIVDDPGGYISHNFTISAAITPYWGDGSK